MLRMLLAALALAFGSVTAQAGDTTPYTSVELTGLINSTIPSALLTKVPWQFTDPYNYPNGVGYGTLTANSSPPGADLWSIIDYRPASTSVNESFMTTVSALPKTAEQGTATLTVSYDSTNNQTTYEIQNSSSFTSMIVPLDLRCVTDIVSKGFLASLGTLTSSTGAPLVGKLIDSATPPNPIYYPFSGTSPNGVAYQGQVGLTFLGIGTNGMAYSLGEYGLSYQFFDTDGSFLMAVSTSVSNGLQVTLPGALVHAPAGHPASAKTGSGTFSQTSGGQTLSGTFLPNGILTTLNNVASAPASATGVPASQQGIGSVYDGYFWNN